MKPEKYTKEQEKAFKDSLPKLSSSQLLHLFFIGIFNPKRAIRYTNELIKGKSPYFAIKDSKK